MSDKLGSGLRGMARVRFWLWNTAGSLAFRLGSAFYSFGLWLCGLAGSLDGRADTVWSRRRR